MWQVPPPPNAGTPVARIRLAVALLVFYVACIAFDRLTFRHIGSAISRVLQSYGLLNRSVQDIPSIAIFPGELCGAVFLFLLTLLAGLIAGRSLRDFGLRPVEGSRIGAAFLQGVVLVTLFMAAILFCGGIHVLRSGHSLGQTVGFALSWLVTMASVGLYEELAVHGASFALMAELTSPWVACVLTSLLFAAAHLGNANENPLGLLLAVLWAVAAALTIVRTGTIWWAVGVHAGWDWTLGYFYGAPVSGNHLRGGLVVTTGVGHAWLSGGSDGPEGSLVTLAVTVGWISLLLYQIQRARHCYVVDYSVQKQSAIG